MPRGEEVTNLCEKIMIFRRFFVRGTSLSLLLQTPSFHCAEYFGEDPKTGDCNTFFSVIVRFIATWKSAEEDNVKRQKLLEAENRKNQAGNPEDSQKRPETAANMKNAMINELKTQNNRNLMVKPGVNEIQDGTFEGIILDMKSQPYR